MDVGPNWIHGTENNPILEIARETKTALHQWNEQQSVIDAEGKTLSPAQAKEWTERMWGVIAAAFKYSDENSDAISPSESLLDFFRSSAQKLFDEEDGDGDVARDDHHHQSRGMLDEAQKLLWMAEFWGVIIGDPIEKQSLKYFWLEEGIDGGMSMIYTCSLLLLRGLPQLISDAENLFVASTYKSILDYVAKLPLAKAEMQFSKTVTSIESLEEIVDDGRYVAIETADGQTQHFDEVVVTAPLGWLKRNKEAFVPALPTRLSQAVDSVSYGQLEKVYITFPTAFWEEPVPVDEPTTSSTDTGNTKDATGLIDNNNNSTSFFHFSHPLYAPTTNPHSWSQEAVNLASLRPQTQSQPTLLFYTYPPCSTHLVTDQAVLQDFFQPYYSRLPHYHPSSPECIPVAIHATSWSSDPLAGYGSYSNFQTSKHDIIPADDAIETMRHGMPDRHIWLAGEHTAPFIASGTVTGAYWAGENVAKRVLEGYGREVVSDGGGVEEGEKVKGKGEPRGMAE